MAVRPPVMDLPLLTVERDHVLARLLTVRGGRRVVADDVDVRVTKESEVPSGWWTDESQFQLERRAIFSKVVRLVKLPWHTLTPPDMALRQSPQSFWKARRLCHI